MSHLTLLGIYAHPDDESFGNGGMLGKYASEGIDVHVGIMTDGASGSYDPDVAHPTDASDLASLRRHELECASEALGVRLHMLGYRDSGMEGSPDNRHPDSLYQASLDEAAQKVLDLICQVRPDVVVTHDPTGGYFHPDHIRTNHAVVKAWRSLADPAAYPTLAAPSCGGWRPARLYFSVLPRADLVWLLRLMRLFGRDPRHFGRNGDIDLTQAGVANEDIHVSMDVLPYAAIKERAGACHASQGGGGGPAGMPQFLRRRLQRYEHYSQAYPAGAHRHTDLFEGLDGRG